jgi:cbb3-type cytochrome oxidase subunit 3
MGYEHETIDLLSWGTLVMSVFLTGLVWFIALRVLGG